MFLGRIFADYGGMRLAIPIFKSRVSPACDFCRRLLIVEITDVDPPETFESGCQVSNSKRLVKKLEESKVRILICGGISLQLAEDIREIGIKIVPGVSGEVKEVLDAYLNGRIKDPCFTMAGFSGNEEDRRGGHGKRGPKQKRLKIKAS